MDRVTVSSPPQRTDVLVVGAGPAGSAAAAWAARTGLDVVLADAATFPRDKTCGDGLTPRAIAELELLGLGDWLSTHPRSRGLRAHGFGQTLHLEWSEGRGRKAAGNLPAYGSAVARTELDDHLRTVALKSGALGVDGARAISVRQEAGRVRGVTFKGAEGTFEIECDRLVVADGVRSPVGKMLGREWHRDTVYAVAARSYVDSERSDDEWISSHLELRDDSGSIVSGYGWIFPLGGGQVNLGVGTLATAKRPAEVQLRPLMKLYADQRRADFGVSGELRMPTSALLPMGGAVSGVAGPNWMLIGDAAACVNPLNGEGIDYGLETGRLAAQLLTEESDLSAAWPALLTDHYGEAFSISRRLAGLVTVPWVLPKLGPIGMRSPWMMRLALRWMGNLITEEDRDAAARLWRLAGKGSQRLDARPPFA
ncbi:geranylgeranyl reductase family protein [Ornithinimicrobium cryptoxanthini]|uniref:Geranylgeranyl reductase family protein n=1 Tax=Ornithinimicrobium cryptoxanthini TaxID=2934161 RepID=A0ABY4YGT9_9MICO|nr:geranylgeranyl reductase family protein [Ornithinimicrobium cryptoxanthini]USQ75558.1 geranylgeranyl reductase family protein [Ornithinimicrobium cryptoxanthini]